MKETLEWMRDNTEYIDKKEAKTEDISY
jgi:hypothetical protein